MDIPQIVRKVNTKPVNTVLIYSVVSLLGLNYLLYSFFDLGSVRNLVRVAAVGLMMILLLFRLTEGNIRRRQVLMLLLAAWQILAGGTNGLNIAFLLILTAAAAGYQECRITTVVFWVMIGLTLIMLGSLLLGIEVNEVYTVGTRTRHKLGFVNVNAASMFLFTTLASYLIWRDKQAKLVELGAAMGLELLIFVYTDSRTPLLALVLMIALYLLIPRLPAKAVNICCSVGIALLFLTSYLWVLPAVNSPLVNTLLSLRPMYCDEYFRSQNALTFLLGGTGVPELDNGYLLLLFNVGVAVYTAIYFAIQSAVKNMANRSEYMKLSFVIAMLAVSVLEGAALRPELLCAPLMWVIVLEALPGAGKESLLLAWSTDWLASRLRKDRQ